MSSLDAMRDILTSTFIGVGAMIAQAAVQAIPDSTPQGLEKFGIITIMAIGMGFLLKERSSLKAEYKAELSAKDAKISRLESQLSKLRKGLLLNQAQMREMRLVLDQTASDPSNIDVTPTTRRSLLRLERRESLVDTVLAEGFDDSDLDEALEDDSGAT